MLSNIKTNSEITSELLQTAKDAAITEINDERDINISSGVEYNNNTYQSDDKSVSDLIAVATLSIINNDIIVPWLTSENEVVDLDSTDIQLLAGLFAAQKTNYVILARTKKDAIIAAASIEEVNNILLGV
jgi:outer membrane scaffolding protein for murein synthesis (MipA/OmpV family)